MTKVGRKGMKGTNEGRKRRRGREGAVRTKKKEEWGMKKGRSFCELNSS